MLIWSYQPRASPFYGGTLSVEAPITRTPVQTAAQIGPGACDAQYTFLFDHADMAIKNVRVGSMVHCSPGAATRASLRRTPPA
jgi:hypothetical protein